MSRLKIAIIEPVGGHGGMNYYDFGLAEGITAAGFEVTVYTCDNTEIPMGLPFDVKHSFIKIWGDEPKLLRAVRFAICLLNSLLDARKKRIALVHYHFFNYTLQENLCVSLARFLGFKILVTAHDIQSFANEQVDSSINRILSKCDGIVAHNNYSRKELIEKTQLPFNKVLVIPHGNYLNTIPENPPYSEARKYLGLPSGSPVLLFFGQIKKVKGLDLLLQALPHVVNKFPDLKLVVAGKVWKDDFSRYKKLILENNLNNNVLLHIRYISDSEVPYFFNSADLVILPYRKIYQSGVLLMAMSYGVPVLVSNLKGMTEVITEGENGFTFQSENPTDLRKSLIKILSKPELNKVIIEKAYESINQNFNWYKIGKLTSDYYRNIILGR
jgi:D-inositol-3-phosphate glycosyltransferase